MGTMLRNCYMLEGTVLFDLGRYKEAIEAYSNVSSLYPDEPFVLETFVQIANCWRRLDRHDNARGAVQQAQIALDRLPAECRLRQHDRAQPRRMADAAGEHEQVVTQLSVAVASRSRIDCNHDQSLVNRYNECNRPNNSPS